MRTTPGLRSWHVGGVYADMDRALAEYVRLGASVTTPAVRLEGVTYDVVRGRIAAGVSDVAFLRLGDTVHELISPIEGDPDGPHFRLLRDRPGPTHTAFWVDDLAAAAHDLLADGAELMLVALGAGAESLAVPEQPEAVLPGAAAAYLSLRSGALIELNPAENERHLATRWGPDIERVLAGGRDAG